ncbi:hypothetical protein GOBAR_AA12515 [Gossypium barbadense]|uniref:PHD-type zinc finger plants domain-containing protein n=1 Tax=Gossypium barbadense TaxID=3634 RepID=A0A2P5XXQ2_GOSBA|nr:hypothetical protein GOBAR_AA12515 [Gossypium barbadense]
MVDRQTVCCMCGDVGFFDKLFRCNKCRYRFQHSYCSNYYSEFAEPIELCDWCRNEERNSKHGSSSKKSPLMNRNETGIGRTVGHLLLGLRLAETSGSIESKCLVGLDCARRKTSYKVNVDIYTW